MSMQTQGHTELALVRIGPWRLALPRREVRDLLSPQELDTNALASGRSVGVRFGSRDVPVLLLDDELQPVQSMPAERRICVVLDAQGFLFGVICDEFAHKISTPDGGLILHDLCPALRAPKSPVKAVLQYGTSVAAVTDARALSAAFEVLLTQASEVA